MHVRRSISCFATLDVAEIVSIDTLQLMCTDHALRAYTPNLTTIYDLAEKLQASRPSTQARHQAVIASSVVRPGDKVPKKRGRPPLHASKKAEVARSRSPASYLGVTYEQPPTSDIRGSSAETPAPSPPTSVSTTQSNSKATPSVEKTLGRPVIPPETAASQMVMSVMNAAAASAEVDDIQMDPDSPVISRRPLPKLRGRSPSDIEPVLKPLANSTIRTRPASSLPEDQKAFALQSQNFMATADLSVSVGSRAERSPALQQPSVQQPPMQQPTVQRHIVPQPALQQSTKESARDPAAPQSHTHTPIQIQVGLPASQGVPLPEQAASPVRLGGPAASHRAHVLGNSSPNVISPASQLPTSGAQGQAQKPPVQATTSTEQVPQMRQQTGASLVPAHQLQTIGPLDRVLLDEIVADTKAGLGLIYEITPSDEDHLQVILHDVLRCCQALQNSPSPERDLEVYPEPVQERLKVVLAGLLVLNQTTDSDSNNLRKSRTSAVVLACKKAIATVFTCHRTREAASRAAAVRAGGTAGQPTNVSHRPSSDQSRPAQLAFQRPAQPAQTNGAPAPSSLSANRLPVKETGRVLAFPQGPQSISPINAKPQHPAEISQLQNAGARVTVHDSSGRPVTAAHLSSVPPQHYTRTGSTSTSQATAASPPVPTVSVPANASQQNQISPITSSRPQSERSHITRSNVARFRRFVQVAVDIPFTTSSPPPPPPATGPPLSMMEQLAFDYARFG